MRTMLNRHIPLDAIARWWYVLVAGVSLGLIFSLVTGVTPFVPILKGHIAEGPPSRIEVATKWVAHSGWKDDFLFAVLGLLAACGLIWLLEEIRIYGHRVGKP